jgi:hypothetical protein
VIICPIGIVEQALQFGRIEFQGTGVACGVPHCLAGASCDAFSDTRPIVSSLTAK